MSNSYLDTILEKVKEEGDYFEWIYNSKSGLSYECFLIRNKVLGNLCGYVVLTLDNKLFGKEYNYINSLLSIDVHGELTYSDSIRPFKHYNGVDNKNKDLDAWIIGFDCSNYGDMMPYFSKNNFESFAI